MALRRAIETARVHLEAERAAPAVLPARRSLALAPGSLSGHSLLAKALNRLGRGAEARAVLDRVPGLPNIAPDTMLTAASVILNNHHPQGAIRAFRVVLRDRPDDAGLRHTLAHVLRSAGDFAATRRLLRQVVALDPRSGRAWYDLARVERDPWIAGLPSLVGALRADAQRSPDERAFLAFAAAHAHEALGDLPAAWHAAEQGHALVRRAYDAPREAHRARLLRRAFVAPTWPDEPDPMPEPAPVFVTGLPRSGTTLVTQMLTRHPGIRDIGEDLFFHKNAGAIRDALGLGRGPGSASRRAEIRARYRAIMSRRAGARRVISKMLDLAPFVGVIWMLFPDARFLWCVRDPLDTITSIHLNHFEGNFAYGTRPEDIAHHLAIDRLQLRLWAALRPTHLQVVRYEALVRRPRAHAERMLAFLAMPWNDACLAPEASEEMIRTHSFLQARRPINDASVGRSAALGAELATARAALAETGLLPAVR